MANNIQAIFSPCHDAFVYYNDDTLICTVCKKVIGRLQQDEEIVTNIEYNVDEDKETVNISSDLNSNVIHTARRHFDDITAELCLVECPLCKEQYNIDKETISTDTLTFSQMINGRRDAFEKQIGWDD